MDRIRSDRNLDFVEISQNTSYPSKALGEQHTQVSSIALAFIKLNQA